MSVIIKDMEMPVDCLACRISCKNEHYLEDGRPFDCQLEEAKTGDLISRADAIEALSRSSVYAWSTEQDQTAHNWAINIINALPSAEAVHKPDYSYEADMVRRLKETLSAEAVQGWIPFKKRPLTDEEKQEYPDWTYIFDCPLPDDEEEILLSNGKYVWTDTFINDGECYLDGGDDIDDGMAWMPLPKPYEPKTERRG